MTEDLKYCASSFLMYRCIHDQEKVFSAQYPVCYPDLNFQWEAVYNSEELYNRLKEQVDEACKDGKAALALSGGIDSAILAKLMPAGSTAYTFRCVVPGVQVTDESIQAAKYAAECGLKHKIINIYWEDFEAYAPILMKHKGAPIHSIEVQIYKAALQAKKDGFERVIYGESADLLFGGLSGLLSKDWTVGDFINRYAYVLPYKALKSFEMVLQPILKHEKNGMIDVHEFNGTDFFAEAIGSYTNASATGDCGIVFPYAHSRMGMPLDYERVRKGENKYLVREIFAKLYQDYEIPPKTPMPRPMNEWFADWKGPVRNEFWPHCADGMTGDQKWLLWSLEKFLDIIE